MNYETWEDIKNNARNLMQPRCMVCPVCNGKACAGKTPGPGGKGAGLTFQRNVNYLKEHVKINMDVLCSQFSPNTSTEIFDQTISLPVLAAPIGMVAFSFSDDLNEYTYAQAVVTGMLEAGSLAFTGGGAHEESFYEPLKVIAEHSGCAVPTLKPWVDEILYERIAFLEKVNPVAFAMDIDTAGLVHAAASLNLISKKGVDELRAICARTKIPFIVKGIMTASAAVRAAEAGVYGIVVSNHGGRVMDDGLSTAKLLPEIRKAVGEKMKIFVDGGVRSGSDVFKMLALGADYVLIGRPYAVAAYGGGSKGVAFYTQKIQAELADVMGMTGCTAIRDISLDKIAIV